jgi:hypothetical protein
MVSRIVKVVCPFCGSDKVSESSHNKTRGNKCIIAITPKTIQETQKLVEAGFEYICSFDD